MTALYLNEVKKLLKYDCSKIEIVSDTNNIVYKVKTNKYGIVYAKVYLNNSSHIDNELQLYNIINNKYLKEIIAISNNPKIAIFKELKGMTLDVMPEEEKEENKDLIINSVIDFYEQISKKKIDNYGLLDDKLNGKYNSFNEFIIKRQRDTQNVLKDYPILNHIFDEIYDKYNYLLTDDNSLVPIDTNLKNIMLVNNQVKFIDPGELISGPKLMGYGDFVAHIYGTSLYDCLIHKLSLNDDDIKRLHMYSIFSSLNILAFLKNNGVDDLENVIPYGNKYTFYNLIKEHLKELRISLSERI